MDRVVITSEDGRARLSFTDPSPGGPGSPVESFAVSLSVGGLTASSRIDVAALGSEDLAELLADLAAEARAERRPARRERRRRRRRGWGDPEGRLAMEFSPEAGGRVRLSVELREEPTPDAWAARGVLFLDDTSLEWAAHAARRFLRAF